jgi:hypothetical protein
MKPRASIEGSLARFWYPFFFIYLDRYEVPNRAGSGLFFILMTFVFKFFLEVGIVSI